MNIRQKERERERESKYSVDNLSAKREPRPGENSSNENILRERERERERESNSEKKLFNRQKFKIGKISVNGMSVFSDMQPVKEWSTEKNGQRGYGALSGPEFLVVWI